MNFVLNGLNWKIEELSQQEIKSIVNKRKNNDDEDIKSTDTMYFGLTYHDKCIIYLDKDLPIDRKKKTLIHELTHCYIGCYITHQEKSYDEEMVCDIVSSSFYLIELIVNDYFKEKK